MAARPCVARSGTGRRRGAGPENGVKVPNVPYDSAIVGTLAVRRVAAARNRVRSRWSRIGQHKPHIGPCRTAVSWPPGRAGLRPRPRGSAHQFLPACRRNAFQVHRAAAARGGGDAGGARPIERDDAIARPGPGLVPGKASRVDLAGAGRPAGGGEEGERDGGEGAHKAASSGRGLGNCKSGAGEREKASRAAVTSRGFGFAIPIRPARSLDRSPPLRCNAALLLGRFGVGSPACRGAEGRASDALLGCPPRHPSSFLQRRLTGASGGAAEDEFTGPRLAAGERIWFRGIKGLGSGCLQLSALLL